MRPVDKARWVGTEGSENPARFLGTIGGSGWRGAFLFKDKVFAVGKTFRKVSRQI